MSLQLDTIDRRDMPRLVEIEQENYPLNIAYTEEDIYAEVREQNVVGQTIKVNEKIIGFILYELRPKRIHIIHLVLDPNYQRCGIGTEVIDRLKRRMSRAKRERITITVRETALGVQLFFKKQGFIAYKTVREYFVDTNEDGYVFKFEEPEVEEAYEVASEGENSSLQ